jgi:hypothetical protein
MNKYEKNDTRYDNNYDSHSRREISNKFSHHSNSHSGTPTKTEIYQVNNYNTSYSKGKNLNLNFSVDDLKNLNNFKNLNNQSIYKNCPGESIYSKQAQLTQLSPKSKLKNQSLQILLSHYEGMCNFILFAKACSPYVHKSDTHLIDDIKIFNFFKNFEKVSAFGLDVNYVYESK